MANEMVNSNTKSNRKKNILDSLKEYKELITNNRRAKNYAWRTMRRNATVLVKGRISHPDHATIILDIWHEVVPNRESVILGKKRLSSML